MKQQRIKFLVLGCVLFGCGVVWASVQKTALETMHSKQNTTLIENARQTDLEESQTAVQVVEGQQTVSENTTEAVSNDDESRRQQLTTSVQSSGHKNKERQTEKGDHLDASTGRNKADLATENGSHRQSGTTGQPFSQQTHSESSAETTTTATPKKSYTDQVVVGTPNLEPINEKTLTIFGKPWQKENRWEKVFRQEQEAKAYFDQLQHNRELDDYRIRYGSYSSNQGIVWLVQVKKEE